MDAVDGCKPVAFGYILFHIAVIVVLCGIFVKYNKARLT